MRPLATLSRSIRLNLRAFVTRMGGPRHTRHPGDDASVLDCRIAYNEHGGYCIPLSSQHRNLAREILAGRVWEPETIRLLASLAPDRDLIHAGTFFGDFLPALSRSRAEGALVWAFEAHPENHRAAEITCRINALSNVRLRSLGLGAASGIAELRSHSADGWPLGGASSVLTEGPAGRGIEIELAPLDELIPEDRPIGGVHLDVEGYEEQALEGAVNLLERWRPVLVVETPPSEEWIERHLRPLGYRIRDRSGRNWVFRAN